MLIVDPENVPFDCKNSEFTSLAVCFSNGKAFQSTVDKTTYCASAQLCSSQPFGRLSRSRAANSDERAGSIAQTFVCFLSAKSVCCSLVQTQWNRFIQFLSGVVRTINQHFDYSNWFGLDSDPRAIQWPRKSILGLFRVAATTTSQNTRGDYSLDGCALKLLIKNIISARGSDWKNKQTIKTLYNT